MTLWMTWFGVAVTVAAYVLSRVIGRRYPSPLTTPVFFSTVIIMLVLLATGIRVAEYEGAKQIIVALLGPATVSLAVPLYKSRRALLTNTVPACAGLVVGSLGTMAAAVTITRILGLPDVIRASISIKSVTAPIAIELAPMVNGSPTLSAAFVIMTGMIGAMLGPWLLSVTGVHDPLARGLALGTISHGQGTAQAVLEGELQGASASIAMGLTAVFVSLVAPFVVPRFG